MAHLSATVCWGSIRNRDCILYPDVGTFVLIRPTQTFYERIKVDHADFSMASLSCKAFKEQKLVRVNFTEADLTGCDFTQASFDGCHLVGAIVNEETTFDGADLRGARISAAHLGEASLKAAIMTTSQAHSLLTERYGVVIADD